MKNKLIISAAVTMLTLGTLGASQVSAEDTNGTRLTIVQRIAQKFNLNESDVQAVIDEDRTQHQDEMRVQYEDRLSQLVTDGEITEAQKKLILEKHQQLQNDRQSNFGAMRNLTPEERRSEMEKERQELETWANNNGIDKQYLFGLGHMGNGKGFGMKGGMHWQ